jgi:selT/selW/selH-like putative selenoprotein
VKAWIEARDRATIEVRPGKSGQFDIVVDGELVYSRYETGRFPSDADLQKIQF